MKKEYVAPALEIIKFDISDIITNSNGIGGGPGANLPRNQNQRQSTVAVWTQDDDMIVN